MLSGSTFAVAAIRTGSSAKRGSSSRCIPERAASNESQVEATSPPSGVVAPSPVTTTVRLIVVDLSI